MGRLARVSQRRGCLLDFLPPRRRGGAARTSPLRRVKAACVVLSAFAAVLATATPASAATLVSNLGQSTSSPVSLNGRFAQGFTTGSNAGGYPLDSVVLALVKPSGSTRGAQVRLYSDNSGNPGNWIFTFSSPTTISNGNNTFVAPGGHRLTPDTTYHIEVQRSGGSGSNLSTSRTGSDDESSSFGWEVANSSRFHTNINWANGGSSLRIAANGSAGADEPYVARVVKEAVPSRGSGYVTGEVVTVSVEFSEAVDVTGTPQLPLNMYGVLRQASCALQTGSDTVMDCTYTVQSGDYDANGFKVAESSLSLNSGTIRRDGATVDADLVHAALNLGQDLGQEYSVNGAVATGVTMESSPGTSKYYTVGDHIEFRVAFAREVDVEGAPQLMFCVNNSGTDCVEDTAVYNRDSGSDALVFRYTVAAGDADGDGIWVGDGEISLPTGADIELRDSGYDAGLEYSRIGSQSGHRVYPGPVVRSVEVTSSPQYSVDTYTLGEVIEVTVALSEAVDVAGDPVLQISVTGSERDGAYARGSGSAELVFAYTVAAGGTDTNGIWIGNEAFELDSDDSIKRSGADVDAQLDYSSLGTQGGHKVRGSHNAPKFADDDPRVFAIREKPAAVTDVGEPATAADADGDTVAYGLVGADASSFEIGSATGQITTRSGVVYDRDAKSSYSLTVTATDGTYTDTKAVTVKLTPEFAPLVGNFD